MIYPQTFTILFNLHHPPLDASHSDVSSAITSQHLQKQCLDSSMTVLLGCCIVIISNPLRLSTFAVYRTFLVFATSAKGHIAPHGTRNNAASENRLSHSILYSEHHRGCPKMLLRSYQRNSTKMSHTTPPPFFRPLLLNLETNLQSWSRSCC